MTNLNSAATKICEKESTPLSPLEVIEFAIKVGRALEKSDAIDRDLAILDRFAERRTEINNNEQKQHIIRTGESLS